MKITTVSYSRLVSGDNYSNQTIGATANLETQDTPQAALAQLEAWVGEQFQRRRDEAEERQGLVSHRWALENEIGVLEGRLETAQRRWQALQDLSAKLGVDLYTRFKIELDDVPF